MTQAPEIQRRGLIADLGRRLALRGFDELRVLDAILLRLELGAERYGELDLSKPRNWGWERTEELLDAMVYEVAGKLAAEDLARAGLREAARSEIAGVDLAAEERTERAPLQPAIVSGDRPRIGLVACGAKKLDRGARARDLYVSPLFRKSLAYAEARCSAVYVLSARHHLLELDQVIDPYEQRIATSRADRQRWGSLTAGALDDRHGRDLQLIVLAGKEYVDPLIATMASWWPSGEWRTRITQPLEGLQVGERLRWLNAQVSA